MKILKIKNIFAVCALALSFSLHAFSGGGGNGGGGNGGGCTADCGYELGPDPTKRSLEAREGPFSIYSQSVSSFVSGFGGGTIYYPRNISQKMGSIVIAPGYTNTESVVQFWGEILASHGFVTLTINTNGIFDQPESRSRQLEAALDHLVSEGNSSQSPISGLVDENRLAVAGFSMGGGGALRAGSRSNQNNVKAILAFSPWSTGRDDFDEISIPSMIMACQSDAIAPVGTHSRSFYNDIPNNTSKALMELNNGTHYCATGEITGNRSLISPYGISWMKRFLDYDRRYDQFLCGPNHESDFGISDYRDNCNYD